MKCRFLSLIGLIGLILLSCHEEEETISPDPRFVYPFKAQVTGVATYNPEMSKEGIDYYRLEVEEIILDSSTSEYVRNIIDSVLNLPTEGPAIINFRYYKKAGWPDPTTVNKFNLDLFWHISYGKEFDMYWDDKSYPYIHENVRVCGTEVSEDPNAVILPVTRAGTTD